MQIAGWIVAVALALVKDSERAAVANECRKAGVFTNKRTGFVCSVK